MEPAPQRIADEHLVRDFQAGSSQAFDELYRRHHRRVRALARKYLRDERDVEEAVQDTFLKAYTALPRFNGNFRTSAWLARITINASIDIFRRNRPHGDLVVLEDDGTLISPSADEIVMGSDENVQATLQRLPTKQAEALRLRVVGSASHREIADRVGGTPQQAKALLHRARVSFARLWRDLGSGAAFLIVAAGTGTALRFYRLAVSASQPTSASGILSAGPAEAAAGAAAGFLERSPLI